MRVLNTYSNLKRDFKHFGNLFIDYSSHMCNNCNCERLHFLVDEDDEYYYFACSVCETEICCRMEVEE